MKPELYEVWGDTVDARHLVYAIGIGAVVSLSAFFVAQHCLLMWVESAQMARAYAMLEGNIHTSKVLVSKEFKALGTGTARTLSVLETLATKWC